MKCLHPISIDNPDVDEIVCVPKVLVPCGKCEECIRSNAQDWRLRLEEEHENSISAFFVTLTYDDCNLPVQSVSDSFGNQFAVPSVSKRDIQLFFKKLRKKLFTLGYIAPLRYFLVSEYGPTTLRPHYHALIFNLPLLSQNKYLQKVKISQIIEKEWNNGFVKVDPVTHSRISYVTKYISCVTFLPDYYPKPFRLMSKGLGKSYLDKSELISWHRETCNDFVLRGTIKQRLPRYLKDKIFDDEMKAVIHERKVAYHLEQLSKLADSFPSYADYVRYLSAQHRVFELRHKKFLQKYVKSRKDL